MKCFLLLILLSLVELSFQFQQVKIGAIFFADEQDIENSFTKAINRLNQRFYDIKLMPIKRYAPTDDSIILQRLACELIGDGVSAIFGPSSKASSDIVSLICNSTGIPQILFDWSPEESMSERMNHMMTINVSPSTAILSKAYADIVNNYGWKGYTIIYESDEALIRLQDLIQLRRVHGEEIKVRRFQRGDDYRVVWKNVRHLGERRVVLDCSPDILVEVINSSTVFNMTGQFNQLFLTNLDTHNSDLEVLNNVDFKANITAVRIELNTYEYIAETTVIPTLMTDAVQLFANAMRAVIEQEQFFDHRITCDRIRNNDEWQVGRLLMYYMKSTSELNGTFLTKNIQFNEWGQRINFNLEIYRPMVEVVVAVWNPEGQVVSIKEEQRSTARNTKDYSQSRRNYIVATREGPPYFMYKKPAENEILVGNNKFEGYAVDLIYKLSELIGFDYTFVVVEDNAYGNYNPETREWNGIVRYLIDHKADIGICDLTITQARRSVVDFTVPFMQLGVSILNYKKPPEAKDLFVFLDVFALEVWVYMLTSYLIISLASVIVARLSQEEWENPHPCNPNPEELENKWDIANTAWLTMGSIMGQGCDILPISGPMRLLNGMWWFFALMMLNSYTANLAAFFTMSKMETTISSLDDLVEQNKIQFGTLKGGSTSNFFSESNDTVYRLAWSKMVSAQPTVFTKDNNEGVERVKKNKGKYTFLMETTSMDYNIERNCDLMQTGSQIGEKHYGIAVPLGSDYRSNLSVAILKLSEKGDLFALKKKWWEYRNKTCEEDSTHDGSDLSMEELGGVFLVLGCGIFAAFVLGIGEFLWNIQQVAVEERITPIEAFTSELMFALKFWKKKKPIRTSASSSSKSSKSSKSSGRQSRRTSEHSQTPATLNFAEKE